MKQAVFSLLMGMEEETRHSGTVGNVTFYCWRGIWCLRMKSSLDKKRVTTDPAFAPLLAHAELLAAASPIASFIHKNLHKVKDGRGRYRKLVGRVKQLLEERMEVDAIIELLLMKSRKAK